VALKTEGTMKLPVQHLDYTNHCASRW